MTAPAPAAGAETSIPRRAWIALAVVCLGQFMVVLDSTIVNVALPDIQRDLGFSQAGLTWVVNAYLVTFGSLLLVAGRFGDLIGRRRVFLTGVVLFTLASVACGLATSDAWLIAARFAQGVGGAVTSSVTIALIVAGFPGAHQRAKAMSVYMFVAVGGASAGLLTGGVLTDLLGWHWIFFINVPIGAVTLLLGRAHLQERPSIGLGGGVDLLGAALVTVALMLGVYAIVGSADHGSAHVLGWGGAALALLACFLVRQRLAANPIMPLGILRVPGLVGSAIVRGLVIAGMFSVFFFGTLYLQDMRGLDPLETGLAFLPFTFAIAALSLGIVARLVMRFGAKPVLVGGLTTLTAGLALFATLQADSAYFPHAFAALLVSGLGAGASFMPLLTIAMAHVPARDAGLASGIVNVSMQVAAALGLAVLAVLAAHRTSALEADGASTAAAQIGGYHLAWALGAGAVAVGLLITLLALRTPRPAPEHVHDEDVLEPQPA